MERNAKRSVLVAEIADILKIERDSVNRRLTGKVLFTVREMGILARKLGISVDGLIYDDISPCSELLTMENPGIQKSSPERVLDDWVQYAAIWQTIAEEPYSEYGAVISSLPMEVYVHYPLLLKLYCFKWAHYIQGMNRVFKQFEMHDEMSSVVDTMKENFNRMKYTFCIWDYSIIWGIVCDINYFRYMELMDEEDIAAIKAELSDMLDTFEESLITRAQNSCLDANKIEHYVSNVDLEVSASYICSEVHHHSYIFTFFMRSATFSDKAKCLKIREWVNSMKRVATLISGSGELARVKFLRRQHHYLEGL